MRISSLFLLFMLFSYIVAGQQLDVLKKGKCSVIAPTVKTLKTLCKLSEKDFNAIMTENGYFKDNQFSTHNSVAYTNGNIDPIILKCFNTFYYNILNSTIECMISLDMLYPANAITDLVRSLKPYYMTTTNDGYDVFKDENYVIAIKTDDKFYRIIAQYINQ